MVFLKNLFNRGVFNMKRFFVLALLVPMLSLAACSNNDNTSSNNSSVSINAATPSDESSVSSQSSSVSSSTSTDASTNTSSSTQDTQNTEMNVTQIQAGDYSSLLGTWIEVAYADNQFDGNGAQWHAGTSGAAPHTLSVSTDKIVYNDSAMVMQGNTITDDAGSHLLSFINNGSSLNADFADANTTINWAVTFYPKGIANEIQPNNGVKIDNTKNLIDIWYSGMQVEIIFAHID
jgi:cytoskeletal protein RodZ